MAILGGLGYHGGMNTQKLIAAFLGVLVFFGVIALAKLGASIIVPMIFALLISFVFAPFLNRLQTFKVSYGLAILAVLTICFIACFLLGSFLFSSINAVAGEIPKYYEKVEALSAQLFAVINERFSIDLSGQLAELNWITTVRPVLLGFSGGFLDFVRNLGLVILFLVFLLIESPYFQKTIERAFPNKKTSFRIIRVYKHAIRQTSQYLGLKALISAVTGILVWLALTIIGLDFAILWGVLACVFNFIPSIGSFFIMAGTILMGFLQFYPSAGRIIAVIISMVLIQVVMGNFLDPKLQGERLKLSPLVILLSLFVFGYIWGVAGMFLAVPMLSVLKIFCENIPGLNPLAVVLENGRGPRKAEKQRIGISFLQLRRKTALKRNSAPETVETGEPSPEV